MRRREFLQSGALAYATPQQSENRASAQDGAARRRAIPRQDLLARALEACDWLADRCQANARGDPYDGAMRSEYIPALGQWRYYQAESQEPFWHTGQAVRTLIVGYRLGRHQKHLDAAVRGGAYMIRAQQPDGFLFARTARNASTASQLEGLCALLDLAQVTGDARWQAHFKRALDWIVKHLYRPGEGRFTNNFQPAAGTFAPPERSRPLIDDATLCEAWRVFKDDGYLRIFREIADRLLRDEDPPGNWMRYQPCQPEAFGGLGQIHPRQAWWWGYPMLAACDVFQDNKYLQCALRTAGWYIENSSLDGACYYHNTRNGRHISFDFCVSAAGCAGIIYADLWKRTRQDKFAAALERTLGFLMRAQFGQSIADPNLRGGFFEGFEPPDATGRQQYYVRDISTAFAGRAMLEVLRAFPEGPLYCQEF
jgi:hypothetical protein